MSNSNTPKTPFILALYSYEKGIKELDYLYDFKVYYDIKKVIADGFNYRAEGFQTFIVDFSAECKTDFRYVLPPFAYNAYLLFNMGICINDMRTLHNAK